MAKSGLEALLEALAGGGMDTSNIGGRHADEVKAENVEVKDAKDSSGSSDKKKSDDPFEHKIGGFGGGFGSGPSPAEAEAVAHAFMDKVGNWSRKMVIIVGIVLLLVLAGAYWWFHPAINIHSIDLWLFVSVFVLLPLWIFFTSRRMKAKKEAGKATTGPAIKKANTYKWLARVPLAVLALGLIGGLLSFSFIPGNAKKYASILPIETMDYVEDIETVNYTEIPVIDRDTAAVLGNKEMGAIADYVSQFEVSDLYSQINYQGTPVRVSPLNYADLIKWLFNRSEGIPAYILVDMTTQDAKIVRIAEVDGTTGAGIKYSQSEPLARNIERYVQLRYPFYMFDVFAFEIDESGHPWWICPVQTRTIGLFGGTDISRVVLCDAVTGETFDYKIDEVPQWVDRAYPSDLLIQQYNWYGSYLNGWFNSWLGQSGVTQTTPGTVGELGYNYIAKDDDVWVYTGVTSATSDASIVGFILINQRTQEAHYYPVVGATETVAMQSAEGQVQHLKYKATFPILINVADTPTYFIALRDGAGLVKKFAMIDIQSYQRVAVGDTVLETQQTYIEILKRDGVIDGDVTPVVPEDTKPMTGTIARMTQVVVNGYSHFYVMLEGDTALYDFPLPDCVEIVMYREGDIISFTYAETDTGRVAVTVK